MSKYPESALAIFADTHDVATLTFYIQTWDEYYTQTLILGIVSGPVEGILTLCIVYAITAVKGGGSFWQQSMLQTIGVSKHEMIPDYFYDMPWNQWYMVYGGLVLVANTVQRCAMHSFPSHIVVKKSLADGLQCPTCHGSAA